MSIKEMVINQYGSINNFVEQNYQNMKTSRTHMYKLINGDSVNPTVETLVELANLLHVEEEVIFNEYSTRYRNKQSESQHTD
jgi:transcriptional regulator with XRE-family HTH domain